MGQLVCCVEPGPTGRQIQKCFDLEAGDCRNTWISPEGDYPGVPACVNGLPQACAQGASEPPPSPEPSIETPPEPPPSQPVPSAPAPYTPYNACCQTYPGIDGIRVKCSNGSQGYDGLLSQLDPRWNGELCPPQASAPEPVITPQPTIETGPTVLPPPQYYTVEAKPTGAYPGSPFPPVMAPVPMKAIVPPPAEEPCPLGPIPVARWARDCAFAKLR
jgi:hypothetical protein